MLHNTQINLSQQLINFLFKSLLIFFLVSCDSNLPAQDDFKNKPTEKSVKIENKSIVVGAERTDKLKSVLKNKKIGLIANQTSRVADVHLLDTMLTLGLNVVKVFSPEHGFRGNADAGEVISSNKDAKTGLPIISLYGNNKKPKNEDLNGIEALVFDLQDVGVRFYTYISTLHYAMEAAAENKVEVVVLDRPNPNGSYIDGPIRKKGFESFVGVDPIPVVHGMTVGELAQMMNGEKWLKNGIKCDLTVISCENYNREMHYSLPVAPSPNLRSDESIKLYPSLCFFEGTIISVGRGTEHPFEIFGHPDLKENNNYEYKFEPVSGYGAKKPLYENEICHGINLSEYAKNTKINRLEIRWLIDAYKSLGSKSSFFLKNNFIDLLAGTDELRKHIIEGKSEEEIRAVWQEDIEKFKIQRQQYLIYE